LRLDYCKDIGIGP